MRCVWGSFGRQLSTLELIQVISDARSRALWFWPDRVMHRNSHVPSIPRGIFDRNSSPNFLVLVMRTMQYVGSVRIVSFSMH